MENIIGLKDLRQKMSEYAKKVKAGTIGFNSETRSLEFWTGEKWVVLKMSKIAE